MTKNTQGDDSTRRVRNMPGRRNNPKTGPRETLGTKRERGGRRGRRGGKQLKRRQEETDTGTTKTTKKSGGAEPGRTKGPLKREAPESSQRPAAARSTHLPGEKKGTKGEKLRRPLTGRGRNHCSETRKGGAQEILQT